MRDHGIPWPIADFIADLPAVARPMAQDMFRRWTADAVECGLPAHEARQLAGDRLRRCEFVTGFAVEHGYGVDGSTRAGEGPHGDGLSEETPCSPEGEVRQCPA